VADVSQVEEENNIRKWIESLSIPQPKTGVPICPFAKKALMEKKVMIKSAQTPVIKHIKRECEYLIQEDMDVIVLYLNHKVPEPILEQIIHDLQPYAEAMDCALMYDHTDNDGLCNGVQMSYGKNSLIFIQRLSRLKQAQEWLRDKSNWYDVYSDPDDDRFY